MSLQSALVALLLLMVSLKDMGFRQASFCAAVVTIKNNGYQGLMVAIHNDIPDTPDLVTRIKDTITGASKRLHTATRSRAFFDEVTIVVPSSWKKDTSYELVQGGDYFSRAEVRVDKPNPMHGHSPYTEQPGQCGEPGQYIHFTPEFLRGTKPEYGDTARVFVHEWAHLRYGVFDEHGERNNPQFPRFYSQTTGGRTRIHPTGCSDGIMGRLRNSKGQTCALATNGMPNADCDFIPIAKGTSGAVPLRNMKASIMYMPGMDSADGFCDDESEDRKHNSLAPNKHNLMCQGRSTWSIVSEHPDFVGGRNPPTDTANTLPKFRVIQQKADQSPAFVLVLDISGSMRGRRIKLLHEAASRFVMYQLPNHCTAGIVSFDDEAQTLFNITTMNDAARIQLRDNIPKQDNGGGTAIGLGLKEALKVLKRSGEPTEGALILLVTDGEENVTPNIAEALPELIQAKVIINTIAFGKDASVKLEDLVKQTGGRGFFYNDNDKTSTRMLDTAFMESASTHADIDIQPIELVNRLETIQANNKIVKNFHVDKQVGKNTEFLVTYSNSSAQLSPQPITIVLRSPTGKTYNSGSQEYSFDQSTRSIRVKVPNAEPGKWVYEITNNVEQIADVTVMIKSEATDIKEQPIKVRSWIDSSEITFPESAKVYAVAKKGYNPVVNATIIATIGRPQTFPWVMELLDNGAGADTTKGDGTYSGYFAQFSGSGRYSVEAAVFNDGKATVKVSGVISGSRAPRLPQYLENGKEFDEADDAESSFESEELDDPTTDYEHFTESMNNEYFAVYDSLEDFERFASAGAFNLKNWTNEDKIPPCRVTDLTVSVVNLTQKVVQLEWTSPGDDMEEGNATMTEVRFHHDPLFLLQSFENANVVTKLLEGDFRPPLARDMHVLLIELPSDIITNTSGDHLFFAVRASDEMGNTGEVSNIALAVFREPLVVLRMPETNPSLLWVYVGVAAGFTLVVLVLCVIAIKLRANRGNKNRYNTN